MLVRLTYYSERTPSCSDADVAAMITRAARDNRRAGITGILVSDDLAFVQMLEGERDVVTALFLKIARDARHGDVVLASCVEIDENTCPDWGMVLVNRRPDTSDAWRGVGLGAVHCPAYMTAYQLESALRIARDGADLDFVDTDDEAA